MSEKAEKLKNLVEISGIPEIDQKQLSDALYTLNEGYSWPDDTEVSKEQCIMCWQLIEFLKANEMPSELIL